jgi:peptide/nickel transport system permease protein
MAQQAAVLNLKPEADKSEQIGQSLFELAIQRLRRDKLTLLAMGVMLTLVLLSVTAPLISKYILNVDYGKPDANNTFAPIGAPGHILGTDDLGRDLLARLLYAGQISLGIGFFAAFLSLGIGMVLGVITGFYGGLIDDIMNWLITTLDSIPSLYLLLIIAAVLRPTPATMVLILALLGWTGITRLVRGETLSVREREYIVSARAIGAQSWRIMFFHIMPNLISIVAISLALSIGGLILTESALSYLGLGIQAPSASWGNMLTNASQYFTRGIHLVLFPGMLITITVLCLYVIGDGVRDAFDPMMKH